MENSSGNKQGQNSSKMTLSDYQFDALSTCTDESYSYSYLSGGMIAEVGELFGKFAKAVRRRELPTKIGREDVDRLSTETRKALCLELGDVFWFVAVFADFMGWKLEDVARMNIEKLRSRQQRGKIVGDGDYR